MENLGTLTIGTSWGKSSGEKIFSRTNKVGRRGKQSSEKGWLYALCPTPELWTEVLPHRTQIVQTSDQAVICFQLSLWDGKIVIEAGTGSGAMTTAMARCVMPRGSVRTFEFNEVRAQKARDEFEMNGLTEPLVVPRYRDVCGEGFGMSKRGGRNILRFARAVARGRPCDRGLQTWC